MKLALITGGSRGLGAALVETYLQAGWEVREFSRSGTSAIHRDLDLASFDSIQQAIKTVQQEFAGVKLEELLLIHNAGSLGAMKLTDRLSATEIHHHLTANLLSPVELLCGLIAHFQPNPCRKSLINISSGAALRGYPGWSLYCTAKAGIENFINTVAEEQKLAAYPFRAINFHPGKMDTAMQAEIRATDSKAFPLQPRFVEAFEKGELLAPSKVASVLKTLLERADLVSGHYDVHTLMSGK
ncbi:MAG: SDR family NAD(P)-dependent oxidoreductase [Aeromonadaceae bacterium]|nr:SDR family NAD(P)-dependent oxidoreductase [Aeromonadaceae bacterium]